MNHDKRIPINLNEKNLVQKSVFDDQKENRSSISENTDDDTTD